MSAPPVEILRWPAQAGRREDLVAVNRPCLWVLETDDLPPAIGPLEDWARPDDSERDVHARVQRLAALAPEAHTLFPMEAGVGTDGLLHFRGHLVAIPPTEARLLDRLAATPDTIVSRDELSRTTWDGAPASRSSLTSRIHTLRKRLRPVGLTIHAIRGHGFLLTAGAPAATPTSAKPTSATPTSATPTSSTTVSSTTTGSNPRRTSWSNSSQPS